MSTVHQVIEGLLPPEACGPLIERAEAEGYEAEAPISTLRGFVKRPDIRNNDRAMFDAPELAEQLWRALQPRLELRVPGAELIGLNERLRFYRYGPGQHFDWHGDGYFQRSPRERSVLTVLVYLSGVELGGDTEVLVDGVREVVAPAPGRCLVFRHHLVHRGAPVVEGTKHVLRSDVMARI